LVWSLSNLTTQIKQRMRLSNSIWSTKVLCPNCQVTFHLF